MNRTFRHVLMSTSLGLALAALQLPAAGGVQAGSNTPATIAARQGETATADQQAARNGRGGSVTVTVEDDDTVADDVDDAVDDAGDDIDEAADDAGDELDDLGDDIEDEIDDLFGEDENIPNTPARIAARQSLRSGTVTVNVAGTDRRAGAAAAAEDDDTVADDAEDLADDVGDDIDEVADDAGDELDDLGDDIEDEIDDLFGENENVPNTPATIAARQSLRSEPAEAGAGAGVRATTP